ncbi:MAG TPA: bifunctional metallophosphatase/5'-nucleotidase, partial [Candidatus Hydrogenedentes bacterium]|nr:bifunctional metallophosphatase/5'-nucleotidase [Candidatus Hydrogenedentota bacterium]
HELVVLHVNDTHGRLFASDGARSGEQGGIARLATLVNEVRAEHPARVLLLHAGDVFSRGDPVTVATGGEANFGVMNHLGYDAFTPGNGDFYWGVDDLLAQRAIAEFAVVHANVVYKNTGETVFDPYAIIERNDLRLAVLGLGVIRIEHPLAAGLRMHSPIAAAERLVPELRKQADLVIALSHLGFTADEQLARKVPGIDLIVGGHSHTTLRNAQTVVGPDGKDVLIVQAGEYGRFLGRLDVTVEKTETGAAIVQAKGKLLRVLDGVTADKATVAILERYAAPLQETVCMAKSRVPHPSQGDSPMAALVADALKASGADVVLLRRGDLSGGFEKGPVALADLYRVHPWRNEVFLLAMSGAQIKSAVLNNAFLLDGRAADPVHLEVDKDYSVAAADYACGESACLRALQAQPSGRRIDELLLDYLRRQGLVGEDVW